MMTTFVILIVGQIASGILGKRYRQKELNKIRQKSHVEFMKRVDEITAERERQEAEDAEWTSKLNAAKCNSREF